jgi:hypothetical protein
MKIILNESQYRKILLESSKKDMSDYLNELNDFAKMVISKTQDDLNINLKMLFIWGAGVGGVMGPLNEFIESGNFNLNEFQTASILCAATAILFGESKSNIKKLTDVIKEEGITSVFFKVLNKGTKLKDTFLNFIQSLNMTLSSITNIMSYAFIIPLLPMVWEISQSGFDSKDVKEIIIRLMSFGITAVSGNLLRELVTKLLNRFRD